MKKMLKKLSSVLLAVAMLVTMMPAVAGASGGLSYEKNQVLYLSSKDKYASTWGSIYVSGLSAKQKIAKSSVKTSNSSVVALESLNHSIYNSQSESFIKGMKGYKNSGKSANISFNARKSGTAKISFKVGNKTYASTVKVLPYSNPLSSLTVTGLKGNKSTNFATGMKKQAYVSGAKVVKATKGAKITCKAAKGWAVSGVSVSFNNENESRLYCSLKPVSSITLPIGNISAKAHGNINVYMKNTKTGGALNCSVSF